MTQAASAPRLSPTRPAAPRDRDASDAAPAPPTGDAGDHDAPPVEGGVAAMPRLDATIADRTRRLAEDTRLPGTRRAHGGSPIDRLARRAVLARLRGLADAGAARIVFDAPAPGGGRRTDVVGPARPRAGAPEHRVEIHDPAFWRLALTGGSIGVAESWLDGHWHVRDLPGLLRTFAETIEATDALDGGLGRVVSPALRIAHRLHRNSRAGSRRNIEAHYDLGNEFFRLFLDPTMTYSAGVFDAPDASLEDAQRAKYERLCRRLELGPEHHLLEIGTGWGGMALHAATTRGCRVTTTTLSREQHAEASRRVRAAGLDDRIEVRLDDYRDLDGSYDRVVSIEMIEAVGHEYLPAYMGTIAERLRPDGLAAIQAITMPDHRYAAYRRSVDFIRRYVFPGSCVPAVSAILDAARRSSDLRLLQLEDFGAHYAETLRRWRTTFLDRLDDARALGASERFLRLWDWYLAYCEAGFDARYCSVCHLVFGRPDARPSAALPALPEPGLPGGSAA